MTKSFLSEWTRDGPRKSVVHNETTWLTVWVTINMVTKKSDPVIDGWVDRTLDLECDGDTVCNQVDKRDRVSRS